MNQWSLYVERALWKNAGLDVQYLGKYSYDLDGSYYINTPLPGPGAVQARLPTSFGERSATSTITRRRTTMQ